MAAMSLRLRTRAFRPGLAGVWVSRQEMHAFDQHIAGEEQIVGRTARPVDGAVVADAEDEGRAGRN